VCHTAPELSRWKPAQDSGGCCAPEFTAPGTGARRRASRRLGAFAGRNGRHTGCHVDGDKTEGRATARCDRRAFRRPKRARRAGARSEDAWRARRGSGLEAPHTGTGTSRRTCRGAEPTDANENGLRERAISGMSRQSVNWKEKRTSRCGRTSGRRDAQRQSTAKQARDATGERTGPRGAEGGQKRERDTRRLSKGDERDAGGADPGRWPLGTRTRESRGTRTMTRGRELCQSSSQEASPKARRNEARCRWERRENRNTTPAAPQESRERTSERVGNERTANAAARESPNATRQRPRRCEATQRLEETTGEKQRGETHRARPTARRADAASGEAA